MKKICSVISISLPVLFLMPMIYSKTVFSEPVKQNSWEFITEYHSYNKSTVRVLSDIKTVWTNKILTDYQREQNKIPKINSISSLMEINCKKREFRIKEDIGYDNKGNVLRVDRYKSSEWNSIKSLTPAEIICNKICAAPKKKSKKK